MSKDIYCDILKRLSQKSVKVVVDATGDLLMKTLAYHLFLIKPNNHELADLFHTKLEKQLMILNIMQDSFKRWEHKMF